MARRLWLSFLLTVVYLIEHTSASEETLRTDSEGNCTRRPPSFTINGHPSGQPIIFPGHKPPCYWIIKIECPAINFVSFSPKLFYESYRGVCVNETSDGLQNRTCVAGTGGPVDDEQEERYCTVEADISGCITATDVMSTSDNTKTTSSTTTVTSTADDSTEESTTRTPCEQNACFTATSDNTKSTSSTTTVTDDSTEESTAKESTRPPCGQNENGAVKGCVKTEKTCRNCCWLAMLLLLIPCVLGAAWYYRDKIRKRYRRWIIWYRGHYKPRDAEGNNNLSDDTATRNGTKTDSNIASPTHIINPAYDGGNVDGKTETTQSIKNNTDGQITNNNDDNDDKKMTESNKYFRKGSSGN